MNTNNTVRNLVFDAPIKTISEANCRQHWRVKSKRRQEQQQTITGMLMNALRGREIELPCVVKLTRVGPKRMDDDNLAGSFKGTRDAIARKLGVDDGDPRIKFQYEQCPVGRREYNIVVEINSVNAGGNE